jgi:ribosomal protein S18 acetylase RimI-like enzyme
MPELVRKAAAADLDTVGATLGRAFFDDPVMTWLMPAVELRRTRLAPFFARIVERIHLRHDLVYLVYAAGECSACAVWDPPDTWNVGLLAQARLAPSMVALFGGRVLRLLSLLSALEAHHLREPHYYLFAIGTDPAHQGRGVGSSLLAPMLARCDAERKPAYLESSNGRNVPFYRRHGFETVGTIALERGPSLTRMRRGPR